MCQRFRDAGLSPYLHATGGKGFHVVAPLDARTGFDEVRTAMQEMTAAAAREEPDRLTVEYRKDKRGNRVFLDTNRNAYAQTVIAPYSPRARPGAPAATPLNLSELSRATPDGFGFANMHRRLARKIDPWSDLAHG